MAKKQPSFEAQLQKLEQIRERLEEGDISLDESIKLYEQGVAQLRECQERLAAYEARIEELSGLDDDEAGDDGEDA